MRYAKKVDKNHGDIRDGLRLHGYEVLDLSDVGGGIPDLAVRILVGRSLFLEVKNSKIKKAEQALTKDQETWWYYNHEITRVVQTLEEALKECRWAKTNWGKNDWNHRAYDRIRRGRIPCRVHRNSGVLRMGNLAD